jgi:hypothetical protein
MNQSESFRGHVYRYGIDPIDGQPGEALRPETTLELKD